MTMPRWQDGARGRPDGFRQQVDPQIGQLRAENDRLTAILARLTEPLAKMPREAVESLVTELRSQLDPEFMACAEVIERALATLP